MTGVEGKFEKPRIRYPFILLEINATARHSAKTEIIMRNIM